MLAFNTQTLVSGGSIRATWLPDDRFFYRNTTATGSEWLLVNPARKTSTPLFKTAAVAQALTKAGAGTIDAKDIPAQRAELSSDGTHVILDIGSRHWNCDVSGNSCSSVNVPETPAAGRFGPPPGLSPDGKSIAFIRDWNLWVRDVATGKERQLTTDGVENFGYATDNAGWVHSDRPIVLWSPDSKKIATQQQDDRHVGDMYLLDTRVGHSHLSHWKGAYPGDSVISMISRVIIDVADREGDPPPVAARLPPRDARRQHQHERSHMESRRLAARIREHAARSQERDCEARRREHGRGAHPVRRQ